ncbi:MAG: Mur ligase family protein [Alistipes sp.]
MPDLYDLYLEHPRVSTDSRHIEPDSIFFALRGATFDGNRFAVESLSKGAAYAVVDDPSVAANDARLLLVDNVLTTLQELAREHRRELGIPILGIVGSNGKTTTKELVSRVLAERFEVYATRGNLNNHIGVPLTLLAMTRDTEFGVVEMGASGCGEIAMLCTIAQPNYGIITNIGRAHLEGFGGPEGVRRGKGELYDYLAENGGHAFVPREDATLVSMVAERDSLATEYYSVELANGVVHHLEGEYNRYNVAAAMAVGSYFDVDYERICHALDGYHPANNRSQRMESAHNTVVADCYNANPSSMRAAIENFRTEHSARHSKLFILGDMLELGAWSQSEHEAIIHLALKQADAHILLVGKEFAAACASAAPCDDRIQLFPTRMELVAYLTSHPVRDALVLVKGSHSIGLENTLDLL